MTVFTNLLISNFTCAFTCMVCGEIRRNKSQRLEKLIGDEDGDANVVREFFARRNYVFDEFLQHQRRARQRINANREVFFTTYVGTWFQRYPEVQFKNDFRLSKLAFQNLINIVGPVIRRENLYTGIPVTDKMLMTLDLSTNFYNSQRLHRWPTRDQYDPLSEQNTLANTIGYLDSFEVEIRQPLQKLPAYTSKKCKTTVKVQVVATRQLRFIDVSVGWPISMHDSRIFWNSSLSQSLQVRLGETNFHLLADTAYPLTCLHNFGLEYDGWIDDAPIVNLELDQHEEDEDCRDGKKKKNGRRFNCLS
ncbi:hypothetical protein DAPPUDRAFT_113915 [Daphnia pulex]|uniref:DDE Tnp4 domain-containing protein n=1 Tax=Daphnia pulex TaxID=6669 RepID=E9HGH3_DAPPU|nr:hypothetical protein DAPPUDRAFT_113915 [Daphnia pulex]|eukprot:EFX69168.1 hypothetical protein DAPPUDRAFT_113915 [Daphnia pulex]